MGFLKDFFFKKVDGSGSDSDKNYAATKDSSELNILNIKPGGIFKIRHYGPNMEDIDVEVTNRHMYSQDDSCWYELQGKGSNGKSIYLEIDMDEDLILDVSIRSDLSLNDINITKQDLEVIDEDETGKINFEGNTYNYVDSDDAIFYQDSNEDNGEEFYYFDFINKENNYTLSISVGDRGSPEVTLSQRLREDQIEVYSLTTNDKV